MKTAMKREGPRIKFVTKVDRLFYKLNRENKLAEQGYRCFYCNEPLSRAEATVDHVVPLVAVGRFHSDNNTVVCCEDCNKTKGCKPVEHFLHDREAAKPDFLKAMDAMLERIEERIRLAEWHLDFNTKGSYSKWVKFHEKRHRWKK